MWVRSGDGEDDEDDVYEAGRSFLQIMEYDFFIEIPAICCARVTRRIYSRLKGKSASDGVKEARRALYAEVLGFWLVDLAMVEKLSPRLNCPSFLHTFLLRVLPADHLWDYHQSLIVREFYVNLIER